MILYATFAARIECVELGFLPESEDWRWTFAVKANEIPVTINPWSYDEFPCVGW